MNSDVSEQTRRQGIASELADILHRQEVVVRLNPIIATVLNNEDGESFQTMAEEDKRNLQLTKTALLNFGVRVEPKPFTTKFAALAAETVETCESGAVGQLGAYALLKQNQAMCGHLVHKSAQLSQTDVREALVFFEPVQSAMERQVVQIAAMMEKMGVSLITGEEPRAGIGARVRDLAAAAAGRILHHVEKPAEDMSVLTLLQLDHRKALTLFQEIDEAGQDAEMVADLFHQLALDLTAHSEAEEQTVYNRFRLVAALADRLGEATDEHQLMRALIESLRHDRPASPPFWAHLGELRQLVKEHVEEEENKLFALLRAEAREGELEMLALQFTQAKERIQIGLQTDAAHLSA